MRLQFSLRTLFYALSCVSVAAFLARNGDWQAGVVWFIACGLWFGSNRIHHIAWSDHWKSFARIGLRFAASVLGWLSLVVSSYQFEYCAACRDHRYLREIRFAGILIDSKELAYHRNFIAEVRHELGFVCQHKFGRDQLGCWRGLVYPAQPTKGITCCLGVDNSENRKLLLSNMREIIRKHPEKAESLRTHFATPNDINALQETVLADPPIDLNHK